MSETLYRIEELATNGWTLVDSEHQDLTREQAKEKLGLLIENGCNPNHLRAIPDND